MPANLFMGDRVRMNGIPDKYIGIIKHKPVFGTVVGFDLKSNPPRAKIELHTDKKVCPVCWCLIGHLNKCN